MTLVPNAELRNINECIPNLGASLNHLPFARLRSASLHPFGPLRAYLKAKSFDDLTDWPSLK